jgi:hypothetical protein
VLSGVNLCDFRLLFGYQFKFQIFGCVNHFYFVCVFVQFQV